MSLQANRPDPGADGTVRKAHYGSGEQPWDIIVRMGYGPHFAAGNVLKNLRRDKEPEHSLESARWYYARLKELMKRERGTAAAQIAAEVYKALMGELTDAELMRVTGS